MARNLNNATSGKGKMNEVRIFRPTQKDINELWELTHNAELHPGLLMRKGDGTEHGFVAKVGGKIIGYGEFSMNGQSGEIGNIWVAHQYRGHGAGSRLQSMIEATMKRHGVRYLYTTPATDPADLTAHGRIQKYLEARGFEQSENGLLIKELDIDTPVRRQKTGNRRPLVLHRRKLL